MIIPNKSTIAEEEIEVPYGREVRDSTGTAVDERGRDRDRMSGRARSRDLSRGTDTDADADEPIGGLSGLSARLQQVDADDDEDDRGGRISGAGARSNDEVYDRVSYGRASVASDRSGGGGGGGAGSRAYGGRTSVAGEDQERIKRDYEYKIATMQTRITSLERDLEDARDREMKASENDKRVMILEDELDTLRQVSVILSLSRLDSDSARKYRLPRRGLEKCKICNGSWKSYVKIVLGTKIWLLGVHERMKMNFGFSVNDVRDLKHKTGCRYGYIPFPPYVHTTNSVIKQIFKQSDPDILEQLRADMENLMIELTDLSRRNDELMTAKDSDLIVIRDLDTQLKEYKRKYEQAKTELRNVKGMFSLSFPYFTLNHI